MSACWRQTGKEAAGQRVFAVRRGGFKKNLGATAHTDSDRRLLWSVLPPQACRLFVALQSEFIARVFPPRTEANRHALPAVVVAVVTTPKPPLSHSVSLSSVSLCRLSLPLPPSFSCLTQTLQASM